MPITALFPDIGGVLVSSGWAPHALTRAVPNFEPVHTHFTVTRSKLVSFGLKV